MGFFVFGRFVYVCVCECICFEECGYGVVCVCRVLCLFVCWLVFLVIEVVFFFVGGVCVWFIMFFVFVGVVVCCFVFCFFVMILVRVDGVSGGREIDGDV